MYFLAKFETEYLQDQCFLRPCRLRSCCTQNMKGWNVTWKFFLLQILWSNAHKNNYVVLGYWRKFNSYLEIWKLLTQLLQTLDKPCTLVSCGTSQILAWFLILASSESLAFFVCSSVSWSWLSVLLFAVADWLDIGASALSGWAWAGSLALFWARLSSLRLPQN